MASNGLKIWTDGTHKTIVEGPYATVRDAATRAVGVKLYADDVGGIIALASDAESSARFRGIITPDADFVGAMCRDGMGGPGPLGEE